MKERRLAIASTLAFAGLAAIVAGLYVRHALVAAGLAGAVVQVAGVAVMLWARVTFGRRSFHFAANPTEGRLVTDGPYGFVRNPIYAGALLVVGAGIATHLTPVTIALGVLAFGATMVRIVCEERLLERQYPEYMSYRQTTPRLLPSFARLASLLRLRG